MPVDIQYLKELKELKDAGALDTDEFKAAKAEAIINEREGHCGVEMGSSPPSVVKNII